MQSPEQLSCLFKAISPFQMIKDKKDMYMAPFFVWKQVPVDNQF